MAAVEETSGWRGTNATFGPCRSRLLAEFEWEDAVAVSQSRGADACPALMQQ